MPPTLHVVRDSLCTYELFTKMLGIITKGVASRQLVFVSKIDLIPSGRSEVINVKQSLFQKLKFHYYHLGHDYVYSHDATNCHYPSIS